MALSCMMGLLNNTWHSHRKNIVVWRKIEISELIYFYSCELIGQGFSRKIGSITAISSLVV